jgi:glycosyltransferase involved in cell wall biosynthesis
MTTTAGAGSMMAPEKKLRVLFLASWYPSRVQPLRGIFVQRHAEAVARTCRVAVLSLFADPALAPDRHEVECREDGDLLTVRIYYNTRRLRLPGAARIYKLARFWRLHHVGFAVIRERLGRPDLAHLHVIYPMGWFALWLKWFSRIPFIASEHSSTYLQEGRRLKIRNRHWLARLAVRNATHVTVVSRSLQQAMERKGLANRYTVVSNVVDTRLFFHAPAPEPGRKKRMLHVSSLHDVKNVEGILRTVRRLGQRRADFELHVVGDGPDRPRLEALAAELGINGRSVFFLGRQESAALARTMRACDFLVLFSRFESLPCVLIEAMASGLPVIATRVGGIPDHLAPEMGRLVEPGDEDGLLVAMAHMLDHGGDYSPARIQAYARSHFEYDAVAAQFCGIYRQVMSEQSGPAGEARR